MPTRFPLRPLLLLLAGPLARAQSAPASAPAPSAPDEPAAASAPSSPGEPAAASAPSAPRASSWVSRGVTAPRVAQHTFESAAAKAKVSYFVYTPEAYDTDLARRFPVLYWLHGAGGGLGGVAKVAAHFDAAIRAGKIPPLLVVFPYGRATSMWCDAKDGSVPMETVVIRELLPEIDAKFHTRPGRDGRIIEGFSMGGYGAARLGFKYPELFGAVSILGGGPLQETFEVDDSPRADPLQARALFHAVYGDDQDYFKSQSPWALAKPFARAARGRARVRVVVGERDGVLANNRAFAARLAALKIPRQFTVKPGLAHDPAAMLAALDDEEGWAFYRSVFGEAEPAKPAP